MFKYSKKWKLEFGLPCTAILHQFEFYCLPWPFSIEMSAKQCAISKKEATLEITIFLACRLDALKL
jgi:hypothetical protein